METGIESGGAVKGVTEELAFDLASGVEEEHLEEGGIE